VLARNSYGYSAPSASKSILAAQKPDKPVAPTTTVVGSSVQISWTAPNDRGSAITAYSVKI
jgi:hypothetical protein